MELNWVIALVIACAHLLVVWPPYHVKEMALRIPNACTLCGVMLRFRFRWSDMNAPEFGTHVQLFGPPLVFSAIFCAMLWDKRRKETPLVPLLASTVGLAGFVAVLVLICREYFPDP